MLCEATYASFPAIKQKHHELVSLYPLVNAVLSFQQKGLVYVNPHHDSFFVCTKSGFSLWNPPKDPTFDQEFFEFLRQNSKLPKYIHLYRAPSSFQSYLQTNWPKHKIRRRAQFRTCEKDVPYHYKNSLAAGFRVVLTHKLEFERLEGAFALDLGNRYWNTREDFLIKAIGACVVTEHGEPVAICYSACVVDGIAEVDILVLPEYRGKGFGKIVAELYFNELIERKLTAHWDTFVDNSPSYMLVQKFGMTLAQEYDLLSLLLV